MLHCLHSAHDISANHLIISLQIIQITFNNGSLGSCIDEERSEVRKVMRFACSVSHRIFERIWHLLVFTKRYACLRIILFFDPFDPTIA